MQTSPATPTGSTLRASRTTQRRSHRSSQRSGLTSVGVALLLSMVSALALVVDLVVGHGLSWVFGAGFVVGCFWVAVRARPANFGAVLVAPPLVFAMAVIIADVLIGGQSTGRFPVRQALDLATSLAVGAPMLLSGTAVAALVVLVRWWRGRRP